MSVLLLALVAAVVVLVVVVVVAVLLLPLLLMPSIAGRIAGVFDPHADKGASPAASPARRGTINRVQVGGYGISSTTSGGSSSAETDLLQSSAMPAKDFEVNLSKFGPNKGFPGTTIATAAELDIMDRKAFLTRAPPPGKTVQCYIVRSKSGVKGGVSGSDGERCWVLLLLLLLLLLVLLLLVLLMLLTLAASLQVTACSHRTS